MKTLLWGEPWWYNDTQGCQSLSWNYCSEPEENLCIPLEFVLSWLCGSHHPQYTLLGNGFILEWSGPLRCLCLLKPVIVSKNSEITLQGMLKKFSVPHYILLFYYLLFCLWWEKKMMKVEYKLYDKTLKKMTPKRVYPQKVQRYHKEHTPLLRLPGQRK